MKKLKHTGSVRDYVKDFSSLMLDIKNMSDEDKLFNFMPRLQPWAQTELRRQVVKDLPTAIAAADGHVDYKFTSSSSYQDKPKGKDGKKNKHASKEERKADGKKNQGEGNQSKNGQGGNKGKNTGFFLCDGPHMACECHKREKLNALFTQEGNAENFESNEGPSRMNPL